MYQKKILIKERLFVNFYMTEDEGRVRKSQFIISCM